MKKITSKLHTSIYLDIVKVIVIATIIYGIIFHLIYEFNEKYKNLVFQNLFAVVILQQAIVGMVCGYITHIFIKIEKWWSPFLLGFIPILLLMFTLLSTLIIEGKVEVSSPVIVAIIIVLFQVVATIVGGYLHRIFKL